MKTQGWALWYWYLYSVAHGPMLARLTSQTLSFCGGILYPHFCWLLPLSGNKVLFLYTESISKNLVIIFALPKSYKSNLYRESPQVWECYEPSSPQRFIYKQLIQNQNLWKYADIWYNEFGKTVSTYIILNSLKKNFVIITLQYFDKRLQTDSF